MTTLAFVAGVVLGGTIGVLAMALAAAAGRADDEWRDGTDD